MQAIGGAIEIVLGSTFGTWMVAKAVHTLSHQHHFSDQMGTYFLLLCGLVFCVGIIGLGIATALVDDD